VSRIAAIKLALLLPSNAGRPLASRRGPPPENLLVKRRRSRPGSGFNLSTMGTVLISIQRQTRNLTLWKTGVRNERPWFERIRTLPNHVFALTLPLQSSESVASLLKAVAQN